jgi:hypothetical protein
MTLLTDIEKPDPWRHQKRWNNAHREARRAHDLVARAIRRGDLIRGQCEVCGSFRVQGHHDRYDEPLMVRWLCPRHHRALHAEQRRASSS